MFKLFTHLILGVNINCKASDWIQNPFNNFSSHEMSNEHKYLK